MKYIELEKFQILVGLVKSRDMFHDWSREYEKLDKKVKNTVEWLERNAKTESQIREGGLK